MVKTSSSNARVAGSIPGWGAKIPYNSGPKNLNIIVTNSIKTLKMAHIKKNILKNQNKNKYNDYVKMNPAYLMPVNYKLKMVNFL